MRGGYETNAHPSLQGGLNMRAIDFAPLYRSTVGFDRLFSILDNVGQPDSAPTYPPYNIERTGENAYRITMAVAGFAEDELSIESRESTLTVKGEKTEKKESEGREYLFRGIAARSFERRFQLADHVEVKAASLENGLLHIELVREIPEAMKPRKIEIAKAAKRVKQIEGEKAAA
jgi:molecular chaperone IbpA